MINDKNIIHEGVIKDVVDLLTNNNLVKRNKLLNSKQTYFSSITKATSNLVLTFPVLVDDSVPLDTARLISKAVEHKMVTMLQMLFSAIDITNNKDAFEFIGKVHKNLTSDDLISFINKMDSIPYKSKNESVAELDIEAINKAMLECIQDDNVYLKTGFNESLNDTWSVEPGMQVVQEAKKNKKGKNDKSKHDFSNKNTGSQSPVDTSTIDNDEEDRFNKWREDLAKNIEAYNKEKLDQEKFEKWHAKFLQGLEKSSTYEGTSYSGKQDPKFNFFRSRTGGNWSDYLRFCKDKGITKDTDISDFKSAYFGKQANETDKPEQPKHPEQPSKEEIGKYIKKYIKKQSKKEQKKPLYNTQSLSNMSLGSDVKKANEEVPSLMIINFRSKDENNTVQSTVIGVKAKIIYISQNDVIDRIIAKNNDNNGLFNFLRATTGEISMLKDFVFAVNKAKLDAISSRPDSSPIWKMLERRYIMNKKNWLMSSYNGSGTAIAVLVVSKDTVDRLSSDYGFKCDPSKLLEIMEAYSIMGFVITDDVKEQVLSLYDDNSTTFEILSYSAYEKEDKLQYKKIINLITGGKE